MCVHAGVCSPAVSAYLHVRSTRVVVRCRVHAGKNVQTPEARRAYFDRLMLPLLLSVKTMDTAPCFHISQQGGVDGNGRRQIKHIL